MRGKIIKGIAGFYYVKSGETVYRCRARGIFKERGIKPAAGDEVVIELGEEEDNSTVTEILPRRNSFVRPFVANVDCFVIVTAVSRPAPVLQKEGRAWGKRGCRVAGAADAWGVVAARRTPQVSRGLMTIA